MKKRPTSVTVLAWMMTVGGVYWLISILVGLIDPMTKGQIQLVMIYVMILLPQLVLTLVLIVSGIGMLNGQNWARLLYLVSNAIGVLIVLLMYRNVASLLSLSILAAVATILFRPEANQYFRASKVPSGTESI